MRAHAKAVRRWFDSAKPFPVPSLRWNDYLSNMMLETAARQDIFSDTGRMEKLGVFAALL